MAAILTAGKCLAPTWSHLGRVAASMGDEIIGVGLVWPGCLRSSEPLAPSSSHLWTVGPVSFSEQVYGSIYRCAVSGGLFSFPSRQMVFKR